MWETFKFSICCIFERLERVKCCDTSKMLLLTEVTIINGRIIIMSTFFNRAMANGNTLAMFRTTIFGMVGMVTWNASLPFRKWLLIWLSCCCRGSNLMSRWRRYCFKLAVGENRYRRIGRYDRTVYIVHSWTSVVIWSMVRRGMNRRWTHLMMGRERWLIGMQVHVWRVSIGRNLVSRWGGNDQPWTVPLLQVLNTWHRRRSVRSHWIPPVLAIKDRIHLTGKIKWYFWMRMERRKMFSVIEWWRITRSLEWVIGSNGRSNGWTLLLSIPTVNHDKSNEDDQEEKCNAGNHDWEWRFSQDGLIDLWYVSYWYHCKK